MWIDAVGDIQADRVFFEIHANADRMLRRSITELHRILQQFVGDVANRPFDFGLAFSRVRGLARKERADIIGQKIGRQSIMPPPQP